MLMLKCVFLAGRSRDDMLRVGVSFGSAHFGVGRVIVVLGTLAATNVITFLVKQV